MRKLVAVGGGLLLLAALCPGQAAAGSRSRSPEVRTPRHVGGDLLASDARETAVVRSSGPLAAGLSLMDSDTMTKQTVMSKGEAVASRGIVVQALTPEDDLSGSGKVATRVQDSIARKVEARTASRNIQVRALSSADASSKTSGNPKLEQPAE